MAVIYKPVRSVLADKSGVKNYYPRVVLTGNVGTNQIAREIADYCSLTPGDVKNTIDNLVKVMTIHLQSSESVTLDGLGTFRITLRSQPKSGVPVASMVNTEKASPYIVFRPAYTLNSTRNVSSRAMLEGVRYTRMENNAPAPGGGGD